MARSAGRSRRDRAESQGAGDSVNIFDPRHFAKARLPLLEAETLPRWCYTSPAWHQREIERVFLRSWLFVGRADEWPRPGDYRAVDTPGGSVLIVRDQAGRMRAFANVCRHRGARLLDGAGNTRSIACPYHSWTYRLDGRLAGAPDMDRPKTFDRAAYGLAALRLDVWAGFVFITFDERAPTLLDWLGDMPERFRSYSFDEMVVGRRSEYEIACDWKLILENALEDYHTGTVHKSSLGEQHEYPEPTEGQWEALYMPGEKSIAVLPHELQRLPNICTLAGNPAKGTYFTVIYPNTQFACTVDCMWWLSLTPIAPERCRVSVGFCFPRSTVALPDFAARVEPYYRRWDLSIIEDNSTGEMQQRGLRSHLRRSGPYCWREPMVQRFGLWIVDRVIGQA